MAREWDASTYDRIADPQARWGAAVVERLELDGDETVLDAGCGSGRVTELLLDRLAGGRVIAVDASAAMIDAARRRLARHADRVRYIIADLRRRLPLAEPVDAILSTATFHWIPDHDWLFLDLAAVLRPGGQLVAQCGGRGNIAAVKAVLAGIGDGWTGDTTYAGAEETAGRLAAAGFVGIRTWLSEEEVGFEAGEPFTTFLRTVVLGAHLQRLPPNEHDAFVAEVVAGLPEPVLHYVRLNIVARRAA